MSYSNILFNLGFIKGWIFEGIVTTFSNNGIPNAAPMGIKTENMKEFILKPFISSQTYKNIIINKCAVFNITSDPVLFYKTTFKEDYLDNILPLEYFEKSKKVGAPKLKNVDASIELKVQKIQNSTKERIKILCDIENIDLNTNTFSKIYCRAPFAIIESIIHATRIKVLLSNNEKVKAEKLIETLKDYQSLISRITPNSIYSELLEKIFKKIQFWKMKYIKYQ